MSLAFSILVAAMFAACLYALWLATRRAPLVALGALALLTWLFACHFLARTGRLSDFSKLPPPFLRLMLVALALAAVTSWSEIGKKLSQLPLALLIGFQAFRIAVEIILHTLYTQGVVPVQMTFAGYNFDIVSGVSALALGLIATRRPLPPSVIWSWNVVSMTLLLIIITIAIGSTPTPWRLFHNEPANTFVTHLPYVWLPMFLVPLALLGHLLVFRRLRSERVSRRR